ncbi:MAG: AAA family ATPase [Oscillospiraceae bacterium]|nr:AAA family ATPase [Oscillospiraceae bacterium]
MTQTIALAGKGGVGKTTISGMLIEYLAAKKNGPVLAVDADANSNLNEVLGLPVYTTLGDIREEMEAEGSKSTIPAGMTKAEYADAKFADALSEGDDYDLLVMGRTQGKGCYCFVNGILTTQLQRYAGTYRYIVVDNEAGMEHLSRGILPSVDTVILVSDASRRGVQACARIHELVKDLKLGAKQVKLLVNRAPGGKVNDGVMEEINKSGMELLGILPQNDDITEYDGEGKPTTTLPADNEFRKALYAALDQLEF